MRITRTKPFSYDVPASNFGTIEELVDADGKVLAKLNERPINLGVQDDTPADPPVPGGGRGGAAANQQGRRELAWRADGQGLTYLEQEPAPEGAAEVHRPAAVAVARARCGSGWGYRRSGAGPRGARAAAARKALPVDSRPRRREQKVIVESNTRMFE